MDCILLRIMWFVNQGDLNSVSWMQPCKPMLLNYDNSLGALILGSDGVPKSLIFILDDDGHIGHSLHGLLMQL